MNNRRFDIAHGSIMEGLKSVIRGKKISGIFGKPEKCQAVEAK